MMFFRIYHLLGLSEAMISGLRNRTNHLRIPAGLLLWGCLVASCTSGGGLGMFEGETNVGAAPLGGSVHYDASSQIYRITGSGEDIYGTRDAFYYAWRKASGDVILSADVAFEGETGHQYRKAGWMVRGSLAEDAAYVDALVHGDGLIVLQWRAEAGGETAEVQSAVRAPASVRLERTGDLFTLYVAPEGKPFQIVGSVSVDLPDEAYAGLVVCAHDESTQETAVFSNVGYESIGVVEERVLESTLEIVTIETGARRTVRQAREHFEAPNWSLDGASLLFNSEGLLYLIGVEGGEPEQLDTGFADRCNNDHGYSPDGTQLAISHSPESGASTIYVLPSTGGVPRQVTPLSPSYWHGWSPDGNTLVYCARRNDEYDVYAISIDGGEETRLTDAPGLDDGPEYSPDGGTIYFNSVRTGQMNIWRMDPDGANQEPVTPDDAYGDWFPHPSPDGKWIVFLSYDKSVEGHPPNKDVVLRIMPATGGEPRVLAKLFGGQGTINVPSWSPDSKEVAFVSYRLVAP